jgi:hypothetical protein
MTNFIYNDGGRAAAGWKAMAEDCVTRAVAIATEKPYQEVYDALHGLMRERRIKYPKHKGNQSPRAGTSKKTTREFLTRLGWVWHPTMKIGSGCKVHLRADELPKGRVIVSVSKHLVAVIDGVINDTFDPSRDGTRCVYGYWTKEIVNTGVDIKDQIVVPTLSPAVAVPPAVQTEPQMTTATKKSPKMTKAMQIVKAAFAALPQRLTCPKCKQTRLKEMFGMRVMKRDSKGIPTRVIRQSHCRDCR